MSFEEKILNVQDLNITSNQEYSINEEKIVRDVNSYQFSVAHGNKDDCSESSIYIDNLTRDLQKYFFIRGANSGSYLAGDNRVSIEIEGENIANLIKGTAIYSHKLTKTTEVSSSKVRLSVLKEENVSGELFAQDNREFFLEKDFFNLNFGTIFGSSSLLVNFLLSFNSFAQKKSNYCFSECGKVKLIAPTNGVENVKVIYDVTLKANLADFKTKKTDKNSLPYFYSLSSEYQRYILEKHFVKNGISVLHNSKIETAFGDEGVKAYKIDNIYNDFSFCDCVNSSGPGELLINTLYNVTGTITTINLTGNTTGVSSISSSSFSTECSRDYKELKIYL